MLFVMLLTTTMLLFTNVSFAEKLFEENELQELGVLLYDLQCDVNNYLKGLNAITDFAVLLPDAIIDNIRPTPECNISEISRVVNRMNDLYQKIVVDRIDDVDTNGQLMNEYMDFANKTANYLVEHPHNDNEEDTSRYIPVLPKISERCNERIHSGKVRFEKYSVLNGRKKRSFWSFMAKRLFPPAYQVLNNAIVGRYIKWYAAFKYHPIKLVPYIGVPIAGEAIAVAANMYPRYKIKESECIPPSLRAQYCASLEIRRSQYHKVNNAYKMCVDMINRYESLPNMTSE